MQVAFAHTNLGVSLVLLALRRYGTGGLLIILRGLEDCEGCADGLGALHQNGRRCVWDGYAATSTHLAKDLSVLVHDDCGKSEDQPWHNITEVVAARATFAVLAGGGRDARRRWLGMTIAPQTKLTVSGGMYEDTPRVKSG